VRWFSSYRYLSRLHVPPSEVERRRVERSLGAMRIFFAVIALVAYSLNIPEPSWNVRIVFLLLGIFLAHSIAIMLWIHVISVNSSFLRFLQITDLCWPVLLTHFAQGPNSPILASPFVALYTFAILAAAFRWGLHEAFLASLVAGFMLGSEAFFFHGVIYGRFESGRLLVRCAYLIALGCLVGTLGENEKVLRAEASFTARLINCVRVGRSLSAIFDALFEEFISLYGGSGVALATHEISTGRVYLWRLTVLPKRDLRPVARELVQPDRLDYLLPGQPDAFFTPNPSSPASKRLTLDPQSAASDDAEHVLHELCAGQSMLAVSAPLGTEWQLRLMITGARLGRDASSELAFARSLFQQAVTAVYGAYLLRRLRTRASAIERARVARELHDGAIQSLVAAEMRAHILRRRAEKEWPSAVDEAAALESLLHSETGAMRDLMQHLKPVEIEPEQLLDHLAERVDRFRRDSGIAARFVTSEHEVQLSAYACREILLMVQEALVNVRKHAKATDVLVSFGREEGHWRLAITDDGIGFGFDATLAGNDFMKSPQGPAIIKERAANLGGDVAVSSSSHGTKLLIRLPQKGYLAHGA